MDEIVIEDKKYISTKRAAKVTGYAKDYVGQLCREGRVPARLVGRSWYVLESALSDHRFGNEEESPQVEKVEESTYPKYQADEIEAIETLSVRREEVVQEEKPERQTIQDAWEAWFDRVAKATTVPTAKEEELPEVEEASPVHISREERVAIHTVVTEKEVEEAEEESNEVIQVARVARKKEVPQKPVQAPKRSSASAVLVSAKIGGGILALFFVTTFVFSTGIFDKKVISDERDSFLAGITVYKK